MPEPSWALVIEVGSAKNSCLVQIPYSQEFKAVTEAIREAVSRIGNDPMYSESITHTRLDERPYGTQIQDQVIKETKQAKLVVAVCTPEEVHGPVPNPNVMYELGLATALGKPTLIVTTDQKFLPQGTKMLPTDIGSTHALVYDPGKGAEDLTGKIEAALRSKLGQLTNPVCVESETVWPIRANQRMVLKPEFWRCFCEFFEDAVRLRNDLQHLHAEHAHDFEQRARNIVLGQEPAASFRASWETYVQRYRNADVTGTADRLDECFKHIEEMGRQGQGDESQIEQIRAWIDVIQEGIEGLRKAHSDTVEVCDRLLEGKCPAKTKAGLVPRLSAMMSAITELTKSSTALVDTLVTLLKNGFSRAVRAMAAAQGGSRQ